MALIHQDDTVEVLSVIYDEDCKKVVSVDHLTVIQKITQHSLQRGEKIFRVCAVNVDVDDKLKIIGRTDVLTNSPKFRGN
jgi:hypothetical protein